MADALADLGEGIVVRPGDVLVIRVRSDMTREAMEEAAGKLRDRFPDLDTLFIAAEQLAVIRAPERP